MTKNNPTQPDWNPEEWKTKILYLISRRFNCPKEDAEDICQDVLTAVAEIMQNERIEEIRNPSSYIYKIASNKINDKLREIYNQNTVGLNYDLPDPQKSALDNLIERDIFDKALKILSERERQILYWRYVDGLSHEEIAQMTGMSNEAVRKAMERALKKIKEKIKGI